MAYLPLHVHVILQCLLSYCGNQRSTYSYYITAYPTMGLLERLSLRKAKDRAAAAVEADHVLRGGGPGRQRQTGGLQRTRATLKAYTCRR